MCDFFLPVEIRLKKKQCFDTNSFQLKFGSKSAQAAVRNQEIISLRLIKAFPLISHKCQLSHRAVLEILGEFLTDLCRFYYVPLTMTFVSICKILLVQSEPLPETLPKNKQ